MSRLRVALLGCGAIAKRHAASIKALPDDMQLVACCARDENKVAAFASELGVTPYVDLRRMLEESRLDLVIVTLPPYAHTGAHAGQVGVIAAAGVNVLVEKPIALEMQRAHAMVEATQKAGVVAACGFMYRFGAAVVRWDEAMASGETGRVGLFVGQFHCNALHAPWWRERAKSGGQMVEQLIHIVDLARHHLGDPQSVYARAANFFHRDVAGYDSDDVSAIVLGYDDGRIAVLNATNGAIPGRWDKVWQIVGERMTGRFTGWNTAVMTHTDEVRTESIDAQTDVFVAQLADVSAAIRDKRAPRVPLAEGAATLRIVLSAWESAQTHREVRV